MPKIFGGGGGTTDAGDLTTGQVALARGGTNADLSATGGTGHVLKQSSAGANITVGALAASDIASGTVATARLGSGTANSTTFLRGDQTWATPSGGNLTISKKTTTYTTTTSDQMILAEHATTAFTITLHAATGSGQQLRIKNIGAAAVTIDGNSSETIDGALTLVLPQYACANLVDSESGKWSLV